MNKIFSILITLMVLSGCATVPCSGIQNKDDKVRCEKTNKRWYNETGWRYDRPSRGLGR